MDDQSLGSPPTPQLPRLPWPCLQVIITQPPLLWNRTALWFEQADKQRLSQNVKVRAGWVGGWAVQVATEGMDGVVDAWCSTCPSIKPRPCIPTHLPRSPPAPTLLPPRPVHHHHQVALGLPIVPSVGNLEFWLRLCGVRNTAEADALLRGFPQASSGEGSKQYHAAAVRRWNADLIRKVRLGGWGLVF